MKVETLGLLGLIVIVAIIGVGLPAIEDIEQGGNWIGAFFALFGLLALCWFLARRFDEAIERKSRGGRDGDE